MVTMMNKFTPLQFDNEVWKELYPKLADYYKKSKDPTPIEEYYEKVYFNRYQLLIDDSSFVIYQIIDDYIWIHAFYSTTGNAYKLYLNDFIDFIKEYYPHITKLKWTSNRPAYIKTNKKLLQKINYKIEQVIFGYNIE